MIQSIMTALGLKKIHHGQGGSGDDFSSRRSYPRRTSDQCISMIDGKAHPVLDWSPGGVRLFADTRPLAIGQELPVVLKFHLQDEVVQVEHPAHIIRKGRDSVSLQFLPLTKDIRRTFQHVIDDFNAREFASSQI